MENWIFKTLRRGTDEYEAARKKAVWNGRVPPRYPEIIAFPTCDAEVVECVIYAKTVGMSIGTKSGGHSWTASFLREGGMLLDLVGMKEISPDIARKVCEIQPGAYGADLNALIGPEGLMFPGGHCPTVGIGGFLLQGGFGWNSRNWGMACESVLSLDCVNADGQLLHCDSSQNADFYWAARGAGCGFFGVVTRFYLKLHDLPKVMASSSYVLPLSALEELTLSVEAISQNLPPSLELAFYIGREQRPGIEGVTIDFCGDAIAESNEEMRAALKLMDDLPVTKQALHRTTYQVCTLTELLDRFSALLDNRGRRYEANNMWTDAPMENLIPQMHRIAQEIPAAPSHLYILWWSPNGRKRPDMAFSMEGKLWMSLYAISQDVELDQKHSDYVIQSFKEVGKYSKGTQLADENLVGHPARFLSPKNYARLETLRLKHDPYGRFHTYMRVPLDFEQIRANL